MSFRAGVNLDLGSFPNEEGPPRPGLLPERYLRQPGLPSMT